MITRRGHRHKPIPHPIILAALLLFLILCLILRTLLYHRSSSSLEQLQDVTLLSSLRRIWDDGLRSVHISRSKSHQHHHHPWPHPTFTHTSPIADQDITVDEDNDKVTVKMHLPNRPKSVRSIKDVQMSVLGGGTTLAVQIYAHPPPFGHRQQVRRSTNNNNKKTTAVTRPHWTFDQKIDFDEGIKVVQNGMKASLKDGELTIVARKRKQGNKDKIEAGEAEDL